MQRSNKVALYDVTSRLIVGGRVYLPGTSVELDEVDGQALQIRGFVKPSKVKAKTAEPAPKEVIPPQQVGVVTKAEHEPPVEPANPPTPPNSPTPDKTEEKPEATKPQESTNGKHARKNR